MTFKARFIDEDVYYPIDLLVPRHSLSIKEAKELVDSLQAEIEIAEWAEKKDALLRKASLPE